MKSHEMARVAERLLGAAAQFGRIGAFRIEAAIRSAHYGRAKTGRTDWLALTQLHRALRPDRAHDRGRSSAQPRPARKHLVTVQGLTELDALPAEVVHILLASVSAFHASRRDGAAKLTFPR